MIHTRQNHHEELTILPQIIGACYVAVTVGLGLAAGWIKGSKPETKDHEKEEHQN